MEVKIEGYAPDVDPRTPGVLTNVSSLIPSLKGMRGAPTPVATPLAALAAACLGAAVLQKADGTNRLIAGTSTELFEAGVSTWSTVTAASGDYSLATDVSWSFAQLGNSSLAVNKNDILQESASSVFANAATGAPKASIVEVVDNFVMLLNVEDQGAVYDSTDRPNGWWAGGKGGTSVWTPSIANESYTGELTSSSGPLIAGKRFGNQMIAYKEFSMYRGYYIGLSGWQWEEIPGEAGAISKRAVVSVGTNDNPIHVVMGPTDFWIYDGSRPRSIGSTVKETVFGELDRVNRLSVKSLHDRKESIVYWWYPVSGATIPEKAICFNYKTARWGRADLSIQEATEYVSGNITWDALGSTYTNWDSLPSTSWNTSFVTAGLPIPAIFDTSNNLKTLNGPAASPSMTTGDYGTDKGYTTVRRVHPVYLTYPSTASMTNYYRDTPGSALTTDGTISGDSKGRFDIMRSANWHRFTIQFTGDVEIGSLGLDVVADGNE